jgi:hypothetical protein
MASQWGYLPSPGIAARFRHESPLAFLASREDGGRRRQSWRGSDRRTSGRCRPRPPGPAQGSRRIGPFLEDCTRAERAIFAIYVPSSKHPFDSPCNLRTSQSLHRAIFVRPAAGHGAIVRDGSCPALILMVLPVWLGRSLDTNGPGTPTLDTKVRSSKSRGIGLPFVPQQKVVI